MVKAKIELKKKKEEIKQPQQNTDLDATGKDKAQRVSDGNAFIREREKLRSKYGISAKEATQQITNREQGMKQTDPTRMRTVEEVQANVAAQQTEQPTEQTTTDKVKDTGEKINEATSYIPTVGVIKAGIAKLSGDAEAFKINQKKAFTGAVVGGVLTGAGVATAEAGASAAGFTPTIKKFSTLANMRIGGVKITTLLLSALGTDGIATWAAVDNISSAIVFQMNDVGTGVRQGTITIEEANELFDDADEQLEIARKEINTSTIANPFLWAGRKRLMTANRIAQDAVDLKRTNLGL